MDTNASESILRTAAPLLWPAAGLLALVGMLWLMNVSVWGDGRPDRPSALQGRLAALLGGLTLLMLSQRPIELGFCAMLLIVGALSLYALFRGEGILARVDDAAMLNLVGVAAGLFVAALGVAEVLHAPADELPLEGYLGLVGGIFLALWHGVPAFGAGLRGVQRDDSESLDEDWQLVTWMVYALGIGYLLMRAFG
jgi:hypothetical protein